MLTAHVEQLNWGDKPIVDKDSSSGCDCLSRSVWTFADWVLKPVSLQFLDLSELQRKQVRAPELVTPVTTNPIYSFKSLMTINMSEIYC